MDLEHKILIYTNPLTYIYIVFGILWILIKDLFKFLQLNNVWFILFKIQKVDLKTLELIIKFSQNKRGTKYQNFIWDIAEQKAKRLINLKYKTK